MRFCAGGIGGIGRTLATRNRRDAGECSYLPRMCRLPGSVVRHRRDLDDGGRAKLRDCMNANRRKRIIPRVRPSPTEDDGRIAVTCCSRSRLRDVPRTGWQNYPWRPTDSMTCNGFRAVSGATKPFPTRDFVVRGRVRKNLRRLSGILGAQSRD